MFRPVPTRPDLVAMEHEICSSSGGSAARSRKLRAQNAGGPRWSFLDGPITANNPMGVHHAWGRTYKDLFQRYHAMLGEDQRYQNGFDCQGLWVEVNVERDLGFKSKRDIEAYGIAEFVVLCKQRVLTYAARQTEQSQRLGFWMDWNDPAELRRLSDELGEAPWKETTIQGPNGPVTDSVEMLVGRLGMPEIGGSYFTFSNENNDLIWGFLAECHKRGWIYKGHDSMPWCPRCGTGISQHEMTEGYQDREDPGLTVRFPLLDRPGEALLVWTTTPWTLAANVAAAVGPELDYVLVRQGEQRLWVGKGTLKQAVVDRFEVRRGDARAASSSAGATRVRTTRCPRFGRPSTKGTRDDPATPYQHRVIPWTEVGRGRGHGHRPHRAGRRRRGLPARQEPRAPDHRADRRGRALLPGLRLAQRPRGAGGGRRDRRRPGAARVLLPPRAVHAPLPALLAVRDAAPLPARRRVVHLDGPGLRQAPRPAVEGRGRREPALPDHGGRRRHPVDPVVRL